MRLHSNGYVEALLYVLIPLLVHVVLTPRLLKQALVRCKALLVGDPNKGFVVREIAATTIFLTYYTQVSPEEQRNHMLQRAIALYVAGRLQLETMRIDSVYQLTDKPLDSDPQRTKVFDDDESTKEDDSSRQFLLFGAQYEKAPYSYEQLLQLQVSAAPTEGTWVEVESGVYFQYNVLGYGMSVEEEPPVDPGVRRVTMTFRLRSNRQDASEAIDRLVEDAFFEYQKRQLLAIARDTNRYMFVQTVQQQVVAPRESGPDGVAKEVVASTVKEIVFKRYPLGEARTFQNLFFEQKTRILHLLDNFSQRRGKFAVAGFPYKLGLLLHGPPGTGKTSLIKAVAQYTKRHIVTVSLAKIKTNQELMNAVFDLRFPVEGRETPIMLDYQDVVFVMEDIDCAGASVVQARAVAEEDAQKPVKRRWTTVMEEDSDKLNLSGLLNVLDGVIDCPGRIVIMTTNHPERLDPALIRPGRVNAQIFLGPMAPKDVVEMLEHYFRATLTPAERKAVEESTTRALFTPAEIEEVCAEYDEVADAISALQAK